jgi:hypothetical protein
MIIFYSSILEYLNLNKYAKKDLFKSNNLYNLDIIATRIYILLNFTDYARFYQYPYMWSMVSISIIGSFFYFQNGWMFNTLTILLFIFFFAQYKFLILKIAMTIEQKELPYTYETVYNQLDGEQWALIQKKMKKSQFTKETLDKLGLSSKEYGNIEFKEFINIKEDPIYSKLKNSDDILFSDKEGNIYDYFSLNNSIKKQNVGFSPKFSSLNKEEDTGKRMLLSLIEAFISSLVLYFSLTIRL